MSNINEERQRQMKNPRFSYIIRSLCGLYLFWIVWDLLKAFRSGEEVSVLMIVAAVAFVIFGAFGGGWFFGHGSPRLDEGEQRTAGGS